MVTGGQTNREGQVMNVSGDDSQAIRRISRLTEEIFRDDLLTVVLKGHLIIESNIGLRIREHLPKPDAINIDRLNFERKLELAISLGSIEPDVKEACMMMNQFRNRFAHNLDATIAMSEANDLIGRLPIDREVRESQIRMSLGVLDKVRSATMVLFGSTGDYWDNATMARILRQTLEKIDS